MGNTVIRFIGLTILISILSTSTAVARSELCCLDLACKDQSGCEVICQGDPRFETACLAAEQELIELDPDSDLSNELESEVESLILGETQPSGKKRCSCVMMCDNTKGTKNCYFGEEDGGIIDTDSSVKTSEDCLTFCNNRQNNQTKLGSGAKCEGNPELKVALSPECTDRVPVVPQLPINTIPNYQFPGMTTSGTCNGIAGLNAIFKTCPPLASNDQIMKYNDFLYLYLDVACGCVDMNICPVPPLPRYINDFDKHSFLNGQTLDLTTEEGQKKLAALIQRMNPKQCRIAQSGSSSDVSEGSCRRLAMQRCVEGPQNQLHAVTLCNKGGKLTVTDGNCSGHFSGVTPTRVPPDCDYFGANPPPGQTRCDRISYPCSTSPNGISEWCGPQITGFQSPLRACLAVYPLNNRHERYIEGTNTVTCDKTDYKYSCKKSVNPDGSEVWTCVYPSDKEQCVLKDVPKGFPVDCCSRFPSDCTQINP